MGFFILIKAGALTRLILSRRGAATPGKRAVYHEACIYAENVGAIIIATVNARIR